MKHKELILNPRRFIVKKCFNGGMVLKSLNCRSVAIENRRLLRFTGKTYI